MVAFERLHTIKNRKKGHRERSLVGTRVVDLQQWAMFEFCGEKFPLGFNGPRRTLSHRDLLPLHKGMRHSWRPLGLGIQPFVAKESEKGTYGLMAIRLDMNKTSDPVEWQFLWAVMTKLGFSFLWIDRVRDLLNSTRLAILINGHPTNYFKPFRGLGQGCPLSPYLFLSCAQGFSSLLKKGSDMAVLKGIKCARNAPTVSHLFFADDTLFVRVNRLENLPGIAIGYTDTYCCLGPIH